MIWSRSPCGERGLKCVPIGTRDRPRWRSLPVRGAWVEISIVWKPNGKRMRRSPCGERGLKLVALGGFLVAFGRSPCGERGLK